MIKTVVNKRFRIWKQNCLNTSSAPVLLLSMCSEGEKAGTVFLSKPDNMTNGMLRGLLTKALIELPQ